MLLVPANKLHAVLLSERTREKGATGPRSKRLLASASGKLFFCGPLFKRLFLALIFVMVPVCIGPVSAAHARTTYYMDSAFTGKYENDWKKYPNVLLVLRQEGATVHGALTLVGDAQGMRVVTIDINGRVRHGVLHFAWQDNFYNGGTATFRPNGKMWILDSKMTKLSNDGRYFEGNFFLKKTTNEVSPQELGF